MNKAEENITLKQILRDPAFTEEWQIQQILNWNRIQNEAYHKAEVEVISDEEISNHIENYIKQHGYKMHDLELENSCVTYSQVENIVEWFKNKLLNK